MHQHLTWCSSAWKTKHYMLLFGLTHSWPKRETVDLFLECPWPTCPCVTFWTPLEDSAPEPFCGSLNIPESFRLFGAGLDTSLLSFVSPEITIHFTMYTKSRRVLDHLHVCWISTIKSFREWNEFCHLLSNL